MKKFLLSGHIDHGKSTLGGHFLKLSGLFDERELEKIFKQAEIDKMSSFKYARLLDTNPDEQSRGMTIEYNQIDFQHEDVAFRLIDTPGHKLYIPQLISAIYENLDGLIGVLVVSCLEKELQAGLSKGQIKEDLYLIRAAGIDTIIVCVNKMDKVDYNVANFKLVCEKIGKILTYAKFKQIAYVPTSGWTGEGLMTPCPLKPEPEDKVCSLMSTLKSLTPSDIQKPPNSSDVQETSNNGQKSLDRKGSFLIANVFILECSSLFSPGYQGILHMRSGQIPFTVERIQEKKFLRQGEKGKIKIKFDYEECFSQSERIIMRNGDSTIGYGIIL
jgi:translation elongation factor EF-1alpha